MTLAASFLFSFVAKRYEASVRASGELPPNAAPAS
jgi:hypothetical protein